MKMRFIGDVHGNIGEYLYITDGCQDSIQVGDFGVGFAPYPQNLSLNHRFIRGNHDFPYGCHSIPHWIPDGSFYKNVYCIGGAKSIDVATRTEGVDWWRDEELSIMEFNHIYDDFVTLRPRIVCTHDCPTILKPTLLGSKFPYAEATRTDQALQSMWQDHRPETWVFGHYHTALDMKIGGTRFICLPELGYIDLEIN